MLVFSKTEGFRHDSIDAGIATISRLGSENGFKVEATESADQFKPDRLRQFRGVVFLLTTGDVLLPSQQTAFEEFVRTGGGFVGIHSATDTEYSWPWYGGLVGAYFESHPPVQPATVTILDRSHPSTAALPERWLRTDEWYNFRSSPRGRVRVLATVDESTYTGGEMGTDHPIAWCHQYIGGRSWYTAMGHAPESFEEDEFSKHLLGGLRYAAGLEASDCSSN